MTNFNKILWKYRNKKIDFIKYKDKNIWKKKWDFIKIDKYDFESLEGKLMDRHEIFKKLKPDLGTGLFINSCNMLLNYLILNTKNFDKTFFGSNILSKEQLNLNYDERFYFFIFPRFISFLMKNCKKFKAFNKVLNILILLKKGNLNLNGLSILINFFLRARPLLGTRKIYITKRKTFLKKWRYSLDWYVLTIFSWISDLSFKKKRVFLVNEFVNLIKDTSLTKGGIYKKKLILYENFVKK